MVFTGGVTLDDMPDFANLSKIRLRWFIDNFPSPHPFFQPAMATLEKKEEEDDLRNAIIIHNSNVGNLNLGSQAGAINARRCLNKLQQPFKNRNINKRII